MAELHVLVNRTAGRGGDRIAAQLRARGAVAFEGQELDAVLERRRPRTGDTILLAGGDGSASLLVDALRRRGLHGIQLALLPAGTGNDLARSLGWNGHRVDPRRFARRVAEGQVAYRPLRSWQAGARTLLCYMSVGLDAEVMAATEPLRQRYRSSPMLRKMALAARSMGKLGYRIHEPVRLTCEAGSFELRGRAAVLLTNAGHFGAGSRVGAHDPAAAELSVTMLERGGDLIRLSVARLVRDEPLLPYTKTGWAHFDGGGAPAQIDGEPLQLRPCSIRPAGSIPIAVPGE